MIDRFPTTSPRGRRRLRPGAALGLAAAVLGARVPSGARLPARRTQMMVARGSGDIEAGPQRTASLRDPSTHRSTSRGRRRRTTGRSERAAATRSR